jgi:uncharacterized membrane protein
MTVLGLIAGVSICIGLVFWAMGAPLILPFALIESLLLVVAFVYHAKAVCDFDEINLDERHLVVRQRWFEGGFSLGANWHEQRHRRPFGKKVQLAEAKLSADQLKKLSMFEGVVKVDQGQHGAHGAHGAHDAHASHPKH